MTLLTLSAAETVVYCITIPGMAAIFYLWFKMEKAIRAERKKEKEMANNGINPIEHAH